MIRNLTPHELTLFSGGEVVAKLPSVGSARVKTSLTPMAPLTADGYPWPTVATKFGALEGLPEPEDGVFLVVSSLAAEAAAREGRSVDDLLTPAELVRDEGGRPIGCRALSRVAGE